ncbi:excalibur calcium-binding domain-containing protein [Mesorhizobium sp. WSM4884]|uniref:excalibur calcium-binding domain-containing protein n=1 Tax=Mesorhizobium sp. WSM4884 TaxID=3038542 RepID=UPI002417EDB7|nr:excalibur calcium-binding domain-containing protein [Mesorhizobium sp. WSM4884]MDG4884155.1 excalibur calcium-binding domain-containing protein [Mesorhizobium sp. WSM4884]
MFLPFFHWPSAHQRRRLGKWRRVALFAPFILLCAYVVDGSIGIHFASPLSLLRHLAAFPNCATARLVGLAPARAGEPGYWPTHDADHDGIACERWYAGYGANASGVRVHRHWRTGR